MQKKNPALSESMGVNCKDLLSEALIYIVTRCS